MYLEYFGFKEEPFNITPNSRFLFQSRRHREALAALLYGIEQRKGFIALTGDIGCGKTTICRAMLKQLDRENTRLALILNPELNDLELLQTINAEFGIKADSDSKRVLLGELNYFLLREYQEDRNVVLLIDEAQRLGPDALEQVRLISNLETETAKLIQIALVGQPELAEILDLPELEQLNQRITVRYHIEPLNRDEIAEYIQHRIHVAEPTIEIAFTSKAIERIYEYSSGVPRRVNVICDRALLVTYVQEKREVDDDIVDKAIVELGGMPKKHGKAAASGNESNAPAPTGPPRRARPTEESHAPAARGTNFWPIGIAVMLGLFAVAYAISNLGGNRDPGRDFIETNDPPAMSADEQISNVNPDVVAALFPSPTATPTVTPSPSPSPSPTATPEPSPTASPTPQPTQTPEPTATPSPSPSPSASPSPTPSPTPEPTATPTPAVDAAATSPVLATVTPQPTPTPGSLTGLLDAASPTATAVPMAQWTYDPDGIVRVSDPEITYPAAILTWLNMKRGERMPEGELGRLRRMTPDQIAALQLTTGRPPLHLREARLPAAIAALAPDQIPALVQVDDSVPGFGPWSVMVSMEGETITLHDPRAGRLMIPLDALELNLTAIVVPFFDPEAITGLKPLDRGDRVLVLQRRLRDLGYYNIEPSGTYDPFTEAVVARYRERIQLPGSAEIDPVLALLLLSGEGALTE